MLRYRTTHHELVLTNNDNGNCTLTLESRSPNPNNIVMHLVLTQTEMSKVLSCFHSYVHAHR